LKINKGIKTNGIYEKNLNNTEQHLG